MLKTDLYTDLQGLMKKLYFISTLFVTGIFSLFVYFSSAAKSKLVNNNNGFVVIEFYNSGKIEIYDPVLRERFDEEGIFIPIEARDVFNGKESIFLSDPLFKKAFTDHYRAQCFSESVYTWINE